MLIWQMIYYQSIIKMSQNQTDDSQMDNSTFTVPLIKKPSLINKKVMINALCVCCILLLLSLIIFCAICLKNNPTQNDTNQKINLHMNTNSGTNQILIVDGYQTIVPSKRDQGCNIKTIVLLDKSLRSFDSSDYPNLEYLFIDSSLKLDTLVVNNSKLTEFSYNSTELLNLVLINNSLMASFVNSNLPNLLNLTLISTHITKWQNSKFGKLQNITFIRSNIKSFYNYDSSLRNLYIDSCGQFDFLNLNSMSHLLQVKIISTNFDKFIYIYDNQILSRLQITNSSVNIHDQLLEQGIRISSCLMLSNLILQIGSTKQILIMDLPSLSSQFYPKINKTYQFVLNNIHIQEFRIKTQQLVELRILKSPHLKKIQSEIPGLKIITIFDGDNFDFNNTFSELQKLSIESTNLTSLLKLQVPKLQKLQLSRVNLNTPTFSTVAFQSLSILLLSAINSQKIIINPKLEQLDLGGKIQSMNTAVQLVLPLENKLKYLNLNQLNLTSFSNFNFPELMILTFDKVSVELFTNNNFNERFGSIYFFLSNISIFANNSLLCNNYAAKLRIMQCNIYNFTQTFPYLEKIDLRYNSVIDFQLYRKLLPRIRRIDASHSNISEFKNVSFTSLEMLDLSECQLIQFGNNYLPKLYSLSMKVNPKLDTNQILEEFKQLSSKGTKLLQFGIQQTNSTFIDQVKKIFPEVIIF